MKAASSNFGNKEQIYIKSYCKVNFKLKNNNNHINDNVFSGFFCMLDRAYAITQRKN